MKKPGQSKEQLASELASNRKRVAELEAAEQFHSIAEETHRWLAAFSTDALYRFNIENEHYTYASPSVKGVFGYTQEEALALTPQDVLTPDSYQFQKQEMLRAIERGVSSQTLELEVIHKDGRIIPVEVNAFFIKDQKGTPVEIAGIARDITERKQAEEELNRKSSEYETIFNGTQSAMFLIEVVDNNILRFVRNNYSHQVATGFSLEKLRGRTPQQLMGEEPGQELARKYRSCVQAGKPVSYEETLKLPAGIKTWYTMLTPIVNRDNKAVHIIGSSEDITERKQAEEALKKSEEKYRELIENISDVVWTVDKNLNITYISPSIEQMVGETVENYMKRSLKEWLPPSSVEKLYSTISEELEKERDPNYDTKTPRVVELEHYLKDGSTIWGSMHVLPLRDKNGNIAGFQGVTRNITELKKAEEALKNAASEWRTTFDSITDMIAIIDTDRKIKRANKAFAQALGLTPQSIIGKTCYQVVHGLESPHELCSFEEALDTNKTCCHELFESKLRKHLECTMSPLRNDQDDITGVVHTFKDITERKFSETYHKIGQEVLRILNEPGDLNESIQRVLGALKTGTGFDAVGLRLQKGEDFPYFAQDGFSEDFLRTENTLLERDNDGGVCRDKDGNVSLECTCGLVISGKTDPSNPLFTQGGSSWTNDSFPLLDSPSDQDPRTNPRNNCIHQGYASVALIPIRTRDRIVGLIQLNDKRKGRFTIEIIEILESIASHIGSALMRKQAEEKLRESEEYTRSIIQLIPDIVAKVSKDGEYLDVIAEPENKLVRPAEELIGKKIRDFLPSDVSSRIIRAIKTSLENQTLGEIEYELQLPEGKLWFEARIMPWGNNQALVLIRDVTDKKLAEIEANELRTKAEISSRLASVGEMAAGVAHEINNPLTSVLGFSELLLQEELPSEIQEHVKYIIEGSNRVKDIIKRLLTFARQTQPYKTSVDIHQLIDNTLELRSYVHKTANIEVIKKYAPGLPWITVDPGQIQQVFMNLIVNAEYAMKKAHDGGTLTVSTNRDGDNFCISIKDDGTGMPKETLSKLFSPFFTTKDPGEGTGLGLSLSRSIILEHGGTIEAESEPRTGTTFSINLPVTPQTETEAAEGGETEPSPVGNKPIKAAILVVDDEPGIRSFIQQALTRDGHSVEVTGTPVEALEKLKASKYDVVLMDIRMPGMSGKELYTKITAILPELARKVLLITGNTSDVGTREFLNKHRLPYISKPFDKDTLIKKVNELLENR